MKAHEKEVEEEFSWDLQGRVIVVDNGGCLISKKGFTDLMNLNSFAVIAFDPAALYQEDEALQALEEFQLFSNATLGSGQPATLYACLEAAQSATLKPMVNEWMPSIQRSKYDVLAEFPVSSVALDAIEGLPNLHWLLLDDKHDSVAILEHGGKALADTLVIQVRIPFRPSYHGQADIAQISHWMSRHGFRFYCFVNQQRHSHLPDDQELEKTQATEVTGSDVLFVPNEERIEGMSEQDLLKLSFILHSVYKIHDFSYDLLRRVDAAKAEEYLVAQEYVWPVDQEATSFVLTTDYSPDIWSNTTQK